jgi:hydroxyacylglutathione hydrolase
VRIVPVPCLKDNYAYLVIDEASARAAIVDPGEAAPVLAAAKHEGVTLAAVWATHHHADHVGGVAELVREVPGLAVVCHSSDRERSRVPHATSGVHAGDTVELGPIQATIVFNPGHTTGGISYWIQADEAVFTGDTLFAAGCGRLFEGTAPMMHESLTKLADLPPETRVYFGHEYTAANLRFAAAVEPDNQAVAARLERVAAARGRGEPTTPSTIADERATNPFLRAAVPAVRAAAVAQAGALGLPAPATAADVFGVVRAWKDNFKG